MLLFVPAGGVPFAARSARLRKPLPVNSSNAEAKPTPGFEFKPLLGFHQFYSRVLLRNRARGNVR